MTTAAEFQQKVDKTITNFGRVDAIVNGGPNAVVQTDNGPVPSFAKVQAGNNLVIGEAQAARDQILNNPGFQAVSGDLTQGVTSKIAAVGTDLLLGAGSKIFLIAADLAKGASGLLATALANAQAASASATQAGAARDTVQALGPQFADRLKGYSGGKSRRTMLGAWDSYGRLALGWSKLTGAQIAGGFSKAGHAWAVHDGYGRIAAAVTKAGLPLFPGWIGQGALLNRDAVRGWRTKAQGARFRGEQAVVAIISDSQYAFSAGGRAAVPFTQRMRAAFGNGGPGWCSPQGSALPVDPSYPDGEVAFGGSGFTPGFSADSANQRTFTSSAAGATATLTYVGAAAITTVDLHHTGGGTISYSYGGAATQVALDAAPAKVRLAAPPSLGQWTLTITVVSGTVTLAGYDLRTGKGAVVHNLAIGGTAAQSWAAVDQTAWRAALARLGADAVLFHLGGNDEAAGRTVDQYRTDKTTLIGSARAALGPALDIIVAVRGQTERGSGIPWQMTAYADAMKRLARPMRFAMFDAAKRFGNHPSEYGFTGSVMQALQSDGLHYNQLGRDIAASGPAEILGA